MIPKAKKSCNKSKIDSK